MTDPQAGTLLAGRYRLGAEIGRGGVGRVFEGVDTRVQRRVAVKLLHAVELRHAELTRFRREALATGSLGHANIVQVTDFVAAPPEPPFIVMERLDGESMSQLLVREGSISIERAAFIASQVLSGLAAAHAAGIVHRDIKPGNVFLIEVAGVKDIVKILDFGVAKLVGDGAEAWDPRLTDDSAAIGTPVYMAPEQARGGAISPETDIYAVGVLLYIALTGREPFYARGYGELVAKILESEPPSIASIRDGVPEALAEVVERAMSKNRSARFASAESMRAALAPWATPTLHDSSVREVASAPRFSDAPTEPGDTAQRKETSSYRALPRYATAFVGREKDLARVRAALSGPSFTTLVGPGGVGKTRLAVEAAAGVARAFTGGVWFVELAACRTREDLARTIVQAFRIPANSSAPDPIELVADWIAAREGALYVLDNVEQLDAAATDALGVLRDRAPNATFLVTSQRPLGLPREELVEVAPLERDAVSSDAAQLFVALGRLQSPTDREKTLVRDIVKRLDGLPLAIELAAARVELLGLDELASRLEDGFKVLRDPRKRGAARHASLENAIEWSWQMLEPDERTALMQCAVFAGGFTLDAAETIVALPDGAELEVLDLVHALRVKSFVRVLGEKNPRFALLESIRAYARARLAESSDEAAVDARHAAYYLERGRRFADEVHGPKAVRALEWLASEIDNLLEIVRRAAADPVPVKIDAAVAAVRVAGELFAARGPHQVLVALVDEVLALAPGHADLGWLLRAKGTALRYLGETAGALAHFDRAVALGRQSRDKRLVAHALSNRATLLTLDARVDDALMDLEEAISIDRAIGDRRHEGRCIAGRAVVLLDNRGEHARAEADFKEALAILREVGDLGYQAHVLGYLASLCSEHGEVAEGRRYLEEALDIRRALGSRREIMTLLGQRGIFQDLEGELSQARASYVETIVQARAVADRRYQGYYLYYLARLDLEQGRLEESRRSVGEAIALLERVRDARYSIFARATSTAERALSGAIADAERELAALRAARDRMADDHLGSIVTLADAFVARARGDGARALALRSAADVRASDDVRLLARAFDCTMAIQPPT